MTTNCSFSKTRQNGAGFVFERNHCNTLLILKIEVNFEIEFLGKKKNSLEGVVVPGIAQSCSVHAFEKNLSRLNCVIVINLIINAN